ncbi:hypothetical protein E1B28_009464 [Marasmius oreades]|uniref:Uncharacterized protein n=1 Tax=Marasmius oreades TaxID=181124 RepID=A0A9P7RV74_9AGAR|nr:uncharacterized protein E1B28_009464 [Marasmius oreades]KAG7090344.1 hypothetical protein E1B28_009464 [Marasmius oreades]
MPGNFEVIPTSRIVDALYGDVTGRRGIQLGRFITTPERRDIDDQKLTIIEDPKSTLKYTPEIHEALDPHHERFVQLIFNRLNIQQLDEFPALKDMHQQRHPYLPFTGGFSLEIMSHFINWIFNNIPGIEDIRLATWITDGVLQDALMLGIEHRDRPNLSLRQWNVQQYKERRRNIFNGKHGNE